MCAWANREKAEQRKQKSFPEVFSPMKTFQQGYSCGCSPEQTEVAAIPLLPLCKHYSQYSGSDELMKPQHCRNPEVEQHLGTMEKGMRTCRSPPRRETATVKQLEALQQKPISKYIPSQENDLRVLVLLQECPGMEKGGWRGPVLSPSTQDACPEISRQGCNRTRCFADCNTIVQVLCQICPEFCLLERNPVQRPEKATLML